MRSLELRIPPPVVGLVVAAGMWALAHVPPLVELPKLVRVLVALALGVIGIAIAIGGVASFRRAKTTVNPLKPEASAALVSTRVNAVMRFSGSSHWRVRSATGVPRVDRRTASTSSKASTAQQA